MQDFFLVFISFFHTLRVAFRDPQFKALALFVIMIILTGTLFFSLVENWRVLDALYFSVVTLSTIGYGDLAPQSDAGKLFTVFYILSGLGVFAAFLGALADKQRERVADQRRKKGAL